ncbi:RIP metalloprotease RseP [Lichenicoccus roseus]|uniref:Zinc metalloprotease n=1 Tax=Lichenicoccus roseus TaxID=2683649 RepID=A0A5R9JG13_9PROT|nr:RIP metalloprotease RseP [Lichenicoccus roseus]TLU74611.1 RIP metalloprotease RseP [Lichenicoccus roseus]
MPQVLRTPLAFALVLGVLVFIHELGHYLAARWRGVHVEIFSIGFGRPLLRWHDRVGTEWRLCILPLGGYVKPHGFEGPAEASAETQAKWIPGRTFHDKPVGSRAIVILAGPVFNFLLAIVLFAALFATVGRPSAAPLAGMPPVIGESVAGGAARAAGLLPGDRIERVGVTPTGSILDVQRTVSAAAGQRVEMQVLRAGHTLSVPLTVGGDKPGAGVIGVMFIAPPTRAMPVGQAIVAGVTETWSVAVQTLDGIWQMLTGRQSAAGLGGPLRIAQLSGQVAGLGFASLVSFIALLSINLGLINLFPIPVLDGGRLVFYGIEAVMGRPVPRPVQEYSFRAGFALIACLFLFVTFNDLSHLGLFSWVSHRVG